MTFSKLPPATRKALLLRTVMALASSLTTGPAATTLALAFRSMRPPSTPAVVATVRLLPPARSNTGAVASKRAVSMKNAFWPDTDAPSSSLSSEPGVTIGANVPRVIVTPLTTSSAVGAARIPPSVNMEAPTLSASEWIPPMSLTSGSVLELTIWPSDA